MIVFLNILITVRLFSTQSRVDFKRGNGAKLFNIFFYYDASVDKKKLWTS